MNQIPWTMALAVFLGTLPVFGAIIWNLIGVNLIRSEMQSFRAEVRAELNAIKTEITNIHERFAW